MWTCKAYICRCLANSHVTMTPNMGTTKPNRVIDHENE